MTTIVIGGDICPMGKIQNAFIEGNKDEIFRDLSKEIATADLSIVNLECPLVTKETPIEKAGGFVLSASTKSIHGFVAARWNLLNLANNHSFDHGVEGLLETIYTIKEAGLACVGAGSNIEEAQKPFIKEINGERIVIYSMAEREFSIADTMTPGANPLDLINIVNAIRLHKQQGIFIVLIHGGKEYYPFPSPEMVRRCRFMVDMGADAVICCHTHCPLPWEIYADRPIIYGLGNLIFEPDHQGPTDWYKGYIAKLSIENRNVHFEPIPYFQSKTVPGAQKMDVTSKKNFLDEMKKKSDQLRDTGFIEERWVEYCRLHKDDYLTALFGYNKLMCKLQRFLLPLLHSKENVQRSLLLVQCETHQEILNTIFKDQWIHK
jgi:poly-gamma-glutamate synthesis protein (capsule biosynthesis protein)